MPIEFYLTAVFIFIGSYKKILVIFFMLLVLKEKREREREMGMRFYSIPHSKHA